MAKQNVIDIKALTSTKASRLNLLKQSQKPAKTVNTNSRLIHLFNLIIVFPSILLADILLCSDSMRTLPSDHATKQTLFDGWFIYRGKKD